MIDLDVPRNNSRVTLLHWLANGTTLAPTANGTLVTPPANGGGAAPYRQPGPPPGDIPHRYVFMLFPQPSGFSIPSDFAQVLQTRVPFDFMGFIAETKLTNAIAANFITVQNTSVPATTTFPPESNPSVTPSGGAAGGNSSAVTSTVLSTSTAAGGASASGGGSATTSAPATVSTAVAAILEAVSTLGKMAGAAMGLLGLFGYLLL